MVAARPHPARAVAGLVGPALDGDVVVVDQFRPVQPDRRGATKRGGRGGREEEVEYGLE